MPRAKKRPYVDIKHHSRLGSHLAANLPRITYHDIAAEAGVSYSMIEKVARGERSASPRVRAAIEKLTEQPWWAVLGYDGDPDQLEVGT